MGNGIDAFLPRITDDSRPFWDGIKEGRFQGRRCRPCGELYFPPHMICPFCFGTELEWVTLSGHGTLYAFTRMWAVPKPFRSRVPYNVGVVDLDEGLRVFAKIQGAYEDLTIGARVEFVPELLAGEVYLFTFRRSTAEGERG